MRKPDVLMISQKFPKSERLCARKDIDALFARGAALRQGPLLIKYGVATGPADAAPAVQILISVPKRNIKLASRRNGIKRQLRELYRLHKAPWYTLQGSKAGSRLLLAFIYTARAPMPYAALERHYQELAQKALRQKNTAPELLPAPEVS